MEVIAQSKSVRISPRKVRLVVSAVRRLQAQKALDALSLIRKRPETAIAKTLKSAIANAKNNAKLNMEKLFIKSIEVNEGSSLKRYHPSTRGRIHPYKKRSSHIKITLEERSSYGAES